MGIWRNAPNFLLAVLVIAVPSCGVAAGPDTPISSSDAAGTTLIEGLSGTVTTRSGAPIAGVFIQAAPLDSSTPSVPDIAILTNEGGMFGWPLKPGRYRLTLMLDGRVIGDTEAIVESGSATEIAVQADP